MTAEVDESPAPPAAAAAATPVLAAWPARAVAIGIDIGLALGALSAVLLVAWSTERDTWRWWVCVTVAAAGLVAVAVNRLLLPAVTGWTVGRALSGIAVTDRGGAPVGPWRLLLRDGAHLLDTAALGLGWLWPLWDGRHRTFADLLTGTEVRRRESAPAAAGRRAAAVGVATALVAVAAAALGYLGTYRNDAQTAHARAQIADAGPQIVEQMLSYDPATLPADFARAQRLVTDGYRPQLVTQQDAVRGGKPVANVYWVTNSAVLTSSRDAATMLLLMQGQRGVPPDQRGITATVKVDFARVGADWRVNNLTVLARPKPSGGEK